MTLFDNLHRFVFLADQSLLLLHEFLSKLYINTVQTVKRFKKFSCNVSMLVVYIYLL